MALRERQAETLARLLGRTAWGRADVEELAQRSSTRRILFAPGSRFEPGALSILANLPRLRFLHFNTSVLSGDDLSDVTRLKYLQRLDLSGCIFEEATLEQFSSAGALPRLTDLWLENTGLSDEALPFIARLSWLEWLILGGTRISDDGLEHLRSMALLRALWVNNTGVSDAGLLRLDVLRKLSEINIQGSQATQSGLDALFAAQVQNAKPSSAAIKANEAQLQKEAEAALLGFMEEMNHWEREAARRAAEIEAKYREARPAFNVYSEEEAGAWDEFWAEIGAQKASIFERCCTRGNRPDAKALCYGEPHAYDISRVRIVDAQQKGSRMIVLIVDEGQSGRFRFKIVKHGGHWLVDFKQRWDRDWQRAFL